MYRLCLVYPIQHHFQVRSLYSETLPIIKMHDIPGGCINATPLMYCVKLTCTPYLINAIYHLKHCSLCNPLIVVYMFALAVYMFALAAMEFKPR